MELIGVCIVLFLAVVIIAGLRGKAREREYVYMTLEEAQGRCLSEGMEPHEHFEFQTVQQQQGHSSYFSPEAVQARLEQHGNEFVARMIEQYPGNRSTYEPARDVIAPTPPPAYVPPTPPPQPAAPVEARAEYRGPYEYGAWLDLGKG